VDVRRWPGIRRFAADYVHDFSAVAPFFEGDPATRASWDAAIRRAQAHPRPHDTIAALIADQQRQREAPRAAREAAARLADPRTVAIVTGQQAGLFGGPLFTLLKALTAIKLASRVEREHGIPAVAVFWIDAEDHDWDEVRSVTVFDAELITHRIALPERSGTTSAPVAAICLEPSITTALDDLARVLPSTEFHDGLLVDLRASYRPGVGMAEAFGMWIERLLGDRGLIVYDSSDQAAKPLVSRIFQQELLAPGQTVRLATTAGTELVSRGYHAQVQAPDEGVALFSLDGGRQAIRHQDSEFLVGGRSHSPAALVELAADRPSLFSPNVLLRPIVQDTLFPTACYVAGPNELAYLAQLRQVYEHFAVPMPLMYPRASATLADSAAVRFLQKYALPIESLQPQDESALNQLLAAQIPPEIEESFASASRLINDQMAHLSRSMAALDSTLEGAVSSSLGKMQHELATLHNKTIQAAKRRDETLRRQYRRVRALLFPDGHPQERTIGSIYFLNQYGPAFIDRLDDQLPLDPGHHWIVTI
jgi:bacillithiol biosynthesis cysteine-adding enzyme BshC